MINLDNIKQTKLEEFSVQRKALLKMITRGAKIGDNVLKPMMKNSQGTLYASLRQFSKSEKNIENIYDLVQKIILDESELKQVEKSIIRNNKNPHCK
jgi:hypothetical protein